MMKLSSYFQVSLIFLLFDNVDVALQYILQIQSGVAKRPLTEWSSHALACNDKFWPNKLIEAVAIIQNYKVLRNLGKRTLNIFKIVGTFGKIIRSAEAGGEGPLLASQPPHLAVR